MRAGKSWPFFRGPECSAETWSRSWNRRAASDTPLAASVSLIGRPTPRHGARCIWHRGRRHDWHSRGDARRTRNRIELSVGVLLGGLVCGWLRSMWPRFFGRIPGPTLWVFESIGLAGFVAVVGLDAGPDFVVGLRTNGPSLVLAGLVPGPRPASCGRRGRTLGLQDAAWCAAGSVRGHGTATPALAAMQEAAKSPMPGLGYGVSYAVGNVLLALWGTAIVALFAADSTPASNQQILDAFAPVRRVLATRRCEARLSQTHLPTAIRVVRGSTGIGADGRAVGGDALSSWHRKQPSDVMCPRLSRVPRPMSPSSTERRCGDTAPEARRTACNNYGVDIIPAAV